MAIQLQKLKNEREKRLSKLLKDAESNYASQIAANDYAPPRNLYENSPGINYKPAAPLRNVYAQGNSANKADGIYPPSANEIQAALLPRERSKENLGAQQPVMNKRYGGAQNVVEQGRIESQRLLMERYQRVNNDLKAQQPSELRNNNQNYYAHYYNNINYNAPQANLQYQKPQEVVSRQAYIPMSQKGTRPLRPYPVV